MSLPVLDAATLIDGNVTSQNQLQLDLLQSLQSHGFVKFINHGFDPNCVDELMEWSSRFFKLNASVKTSISNNIGLNPQRGYSGIGGENLKSFDLDGKGDDFVDVKEHFDQGPCNDDSFPNQWPPETRENGLIGFRIFMEDFFDKGFQIAFQFLTVLERALKVRPGTLTKRCNKNHNELRLNHYPATTIEEIKQGRIRRSGAHTDYGVLTLLFQDQSGGLEIQDRAASTVRFVPVSANNKYELVVNVADTLERWTNGVVPAGLHQVTLPGDRHNDTSGLLPERYSVAYFMKSNRDELVGSLEEFVRKQESAKYPNITAIDYHKQRHAVLYS